MSRHLAPFLANARRQLEAVRTVTGVPVTFRGGTYYVRSGEVSGAETGQQALSREFLGRFVANADPRFFKFNAADFSPNTDVPLPEPREFVTYLGWAYEITGVTADAHGEDAFAIRCLANKAVYPTETYTFAESAPTLAGVTLSATATVT